MPNLSDVLPPKVDMPVSSQNRQTPYGRLATFVFMLAGLFWLCIAVSMFQSRVTAAEDNVAMKVTLENWGPPFFAAFFGLGWGTVHIIGIALQHKRKITAITGYIAWMAVGLVLPSIMFLFGGDSLFKDLSVVGMTLVMGGSFLRQSVFQPEARSRWWRSFR